MNTPITLDLILEIIAVIVAVQGLFKAIEWGIGKITSQHDKAQKIDENSESLEEYKQKTDKEIEELKISINKAHQYAFDSLNEIKNNITNTLNDHKDEYLARIKGVENSILEMQAVYQQTVAIVDVKIENLTRQVEKHNSVVERTFICERDIAVLTQKETASEKRIRVLEDGQREKRKDE